MLIYEGRQVIEDRTPDAQHPYVAAWRAYYQSLVASGVYVFGTPLERIETATTVRLKDGKRQVQDGPYADTKEQLGGFVILDLPSLDAALEVAARCPAAAYGAVEIRPRAQVMQDVIEA
jgi:hypothetical protein